MIEALRGQFDLAWALTDLHLSALTEEDFLWEPAAVVWTMHRDAAGSWYPDWAETEPDPIPVPTVGWLTWHIIYWWSAAADELTGRPARPPGEIGWPGPMNSVRAIRSLCDRWRQILATLSHDDLGAPCAFPWGPGGGRTVADTVLWLNIELTKNGSEIGALRMMRAAR
ncbi:DinB family protein [Mycolicibacterium diernhoferi]|uniref:Damage-inducible protein DinB n=1 Tax=Mycolicibacterium diernhoferi TaxID=1801 RepID=A0A1Q4HJG6_9MYCO|nr:DinB family protein [Mycolicibacterium diernhoferi]OJZ67670.1 damage-inducible protein DinB [Mycolicibacterium diernhoferi]OPE54186.1 damage-inducible protein DinB [Mycolicibacterium diernhoferi]PEG53916.1 DinB family protein [Mycolicibacterium diernhoferi]QYL20311.1 DinB family protein [Mycolicibacterium diernhoferi]